MPLNRFALVLGFLAISPPVQGNGEEQAERPAKVMRDAASHESIAAVAREEMSKRVDPFATMERTAGEDPSVVNRPKDLIERSDVICFNGFATLVPKRAILHIPDYYKARVGIQQGARIISWSDFMTRNRGWVRQHEVDRATAEGKTPLGEEVVDRFKKSNQMIVATLRGGPISVLPPQVEEPADSEGVETASASQDAANQSSR